MQILTENFTTNAWCISNKGKIIPLKVHPFGAIGEDAIEEAAWLFTVRDSMPSKFLIQYIINEIYYQYVEGNCLSFKDINNIVREEILNIESLKNTRDVEEIITDVCVLFLMPTYSMLRESTTNLGNRIKSHLNENYLRVRYGSEYQNKIEKEGSIYFRTSSTDGFNWYPTIIKFLDSISANYNIKDVTVKRDASATGSNKIYIDHVDINEFLLNKPRIIESIKNCGTIQY